MNQKQEEVIKLVNELNEDEKNFIISELFKAVPRRTYNKLIYAIVILIFILGILTILYIVSKNRKDIYDELRRLNTDAGETGISYYLMPEGSILQVDRQREIENMKFCIERIRHSESELLKLRKKENYMTGAEKSLDDFSKRILQEQIELYLEDIIRSSSYLQDKELTEQVKALKELYLQSKKTDEMPMLNVGYMMQITDKVEFIEKTSHFIKERRNQ